MTALVIDGHPNPESLTAAVAKRYAEKHGAATLLAVRDLDFDLVLHLGRQGQQVPEPDLLRAQALIESADHVVIVSPVWWGSVPALLKGFLDRVFIPGWAFSYRSGGAVDQHLSGRTARIIVTTDSPIWYLRMVGDSTVKQVRGRVLQFCGFSPVTTTRLGPVRGSSPEQRAGWLKSVEESAVSDAAATNRRSARRR